MEEKQFFQEEIRCGYKVTAKTKKVWAVQLAMLDEVERICQKYGLKYFADSGTLIGAVRHKGYIPWDDDIDLVMLREDYEKFISAAKEELPEHLKLQTVFLENNYLRAHAQIRDSRTTGCNEEDVRAGYNCGIFIDIFPLDNMPDNRKTAEKWAKQLQFVWTVLYNWYRFDYYDEKSVMGTALHGLGKLLHISMKKAYSFYEKLCRRYDKKPTRFVCDTVFVRYLEKNTWERSWFDEVIYLPFENRMIPAPAGFDGRLRAEYGDYMKPAKAPTMHGGLILEPDVSYVEYLKEKMLRQK